MKPIAYSFLSLLALACWLLCNSLAQAQNRPGSLRMMYEAAFQEHERRTFHYFKSPHRGLGTYQMSLGVSKDLLWDETGRLFVGAAYGLEVNTFNRRFDHCALKPYLDEFGECNEMLLFVKQHSYHQLRLSGGAAYNLYRNPTSGFRIYAHAMAMPSLQFAKTYWQSSRGLGGIHTQWQLAFFSLEANGGLGFSLHDMDFSLYYRMYNYRRVDRILFDKLLEIPEDYEERNLFKVGVMVSTPLPEFRWLKKKGD